MVSRLSKFIKTSWFHPNNREGILVKVKNNNDDGGLKAFLLGLGIGAIGYAIMSFFSKPKCPKCNSHIERYKPVCPYCKTPLEWKIK